MSVTIQQIKAARELVGLTQSQIAELSGLSLPTIKRAESSRDVPISDAAIDKIVAALKAKGIVFLEKDKAGGLGVRMKR